MKAILSPRELADAIGVSESSIKRWADDGLVRVTRTAGGHRRIPLREALRFVRDSRSELVRPEVLGLKEIEAARRQAGAEGEDEQLFRFLRDGAGAEARGLIFSLYLSGASVAEIVDGPLRWSMERLGELWHGDGEAGIFWEHRATDLCIQALNQLRAVMGGGEGAPKALGGAPAGDPYILPSLAAATVMDSLGFDATNLGPDTPLATIGAACAAERPDLVWVSVSVVEDLARLEREIRTLLQQVVAVGASLVIGGNQGPAVKLSSHPSLLVGRSMAELEAFVKGLSTSRAGGPVRRA